MKISLKLFMIALLVTLVSCVESSAPTEPQIPEGTIEVPQVPDVGGDPSNKPPEVTPPEPVVPLPSNSAAIGSDLTLDVATWNVETFPKANNTVDSLAEILKTWELDLVAIQEVQSVSDLATVASKVPDYKAIVSKFGDGRNRMGILYDTKEVEFVSQEDILTNNRYAFPRPPLQATFKVKRTGETITFISIHLKAHGNSKSQKRRIEANKLLKQHIDALVAIDDETKLILLGDFNSQLDQEEMTPWLGTSSFEVATSGLFDNNIYSYFSGRQSLIDHIVTRRVSFDDVMVPRPYDSLDQYERVISDHLPVVGIAY